MHDIAIIGGGPGGLYAAARLASRGFDVAVFEEHPVPGTPVHCTGILANEAFDEFDLPRDAILNSLTTAHFFGPSGAVIQYSSPRVEALVIDRAIFDGQLAFAARAAGASIQVGARITGLSVSDRGVVLTAGPSDQIEARACIVACGANYTLQRRLGLGMPSLYARSAQIEVPAERPGHVEVHFGEDVAPKGFAWAVPVRRGDRSFARIGLMGEGNVREYLDRFLTKIAPRWRVSQTAFGLAPRTKLLPLAPIPKTYAHRIIVVGDAAGIVKATTGGGIYYSLLSGKIAADVLAKALRKDDLGEVALFPYERQWRAALGDELAAQLTLRNIADGLSDDEIDELFELARTDGIMPIVRRTATFNRHRNLILSLLSHPPARRVLLRKAFGRALTA